MSLVSGAELLSATPTVGALFVSVMVTGAVLLSSVPSLAFQVNVSVPT